MVAGSVAICNLLRETPFRNATDPPVAPQKEVHVSDRTAPMEWLDDLEIEISEREVMVDLDPAILLWEKVFSPAS